MMEKQLVEYEIMFNLKSWYAMSVAKIKHYSKTENSWYTPASSGALTPLYYLNYYV